MLSPAAISDRLSVPATLPRLRVIPTDVAHRHQTHPMHLLTMCLPNTATDRVDHDRHHRVVECDHRSAPNLWDAI
jgi:hypothetical protein